MYSGADARGQLGDAAIRDLSVSLLSDGAFEDAFYPLDSDDFRQQCFRYWQRHKLGPVIARKIIAQPALDHSWRAQATEEMSVNAGRALQQLAQLSGLVELLAEAGIEAMPLKGVALSLLLYGDAGYRHCGDIDLLVPDGEVDAALDVLLRSGYRPQYPAQIQQSGTVRTSHWVRHHEFRLVAPQGGIVELHRRLSSLHEILPEDFNALRANAVPVNVGRGQLYTIGPRYLLGYLSVHAMFSRWATMKWLFDLPAVVERFGGESVEAAYAMAGERGFVPLLDAALALAARLRGQEAPVCVGSIRRRAHLVDAVWRRLGDSRYAFDNRSDPLRLALFRMGLLTGLQPRLGIAGLWWRRLIG